MTQQQTKFPPFNDHGAGCKGHANFLLDCTYEKQEDRDLLVTVLSAYIRDEKA